LSTIVDKRKGKEEGVMHKGRELQTRLREYNLSYPWLINELEKVGITTEKTELSSAFSGARRGNKVDAILEHTQKILDDYESSFIRRD